MDVKADIFETSLIGEPLEVDRVASFEVYIHINAVG